MEISRAFLRALHIQAARSWHDIVTVDESRFCFTTDHELIWLAQGKEIAEREWHMAQSLKMMIIAIWSSINFYVLAVLSKGSKFNAHSDISIILQSLADWHVSKVEATNRKLIVHVYNA
jgi:hypothetical protein